MATSTSWTLWKRLPPRYQLSVRTFVDEDDVERFSPPSSPNLQRKGSPRQARTEHRSPRSRLSSPTPGQKRSIQNIPNLSEQDNAEDRPSSPSGTFFPYRKSGYIDHFKTQQRVNSARAMMASTDGRSRSPSPTGRLSKTPSHTESRLKTDKSTTDASTNSDSTESKDKLNRCKHHNTSEDVEKQETYPHYSNKLEQRKYLVRETDEGTMYIDRGKIIYFRRYKSSPVSQASYMSRYNDGGYLASIRREYLSKPRLLAMVPGKKKEVDETKVHEERANYNRKVAHILDYYSYPDEDIISVDDLSKYTTTSRRLNSPRRHMNMTSRNVKRIYFAYPKSEHEPKPSHVSDMHNEPAPYFKLNQQSKLHDRNFYLKTPGHKSSFREAEMLDCACGMCRIEMQLAMMAQAESERQARFQKVKPKDISAKILHDVGDRTPVGDNSVELNSDIPVKKDDEIKNIEQKSKSVEDDNKDKETPDKDNKLEQILTVTIPKMETNREISEVSRENEKTVEQAEQNA